MHLSAMILSILLSIPLFAASPFTKNLPRGLAAFEKPVVLSILKAPGTPPQGPVESLGEWEEAESVMTLWSNPSYIKALADNGKVTLLADDSSAQNQWNQWLQRYQISASNISYLLVPTDSMWVRDYGPLWIVDGQNKVGIVDHIYNRPRYSDDKVPVAIAQKLNLPLYTTELVHTGGNYYNDGYGNAFSSVLVFKENRGLSQTEIFNRMFSFLGIVEYTTSSLGEDVTIEHIDTFGKLVAPDTWVFSDFPDYSEFKQDADNMVAKLKNLKSPYGTPYKIFRMPMVTLYGGNSEDYRAYINSFISNGVLYFPTYGNDANDQRALSIYQQALPGYKIVGVDNGSTDWGDSVHCRSRNLISRNAVFLFPKIVNNEIELKLIPNKAFVLSQAPQLSLSINGSNQLVNMEQRTENHYSYSLPQMRSGDKVSFYVGVKSTDGKIKTSPGKAPAQTIDWTVP